MNSWGARIKAAISGEVDGADVRALLASTVPLTALQQSLADRRLEAEIGHQGEEWLVAVDLSEVAAPLWLADAATTLAGSLVDAEAEAHPARPGTLSALSHYHAMILLEPVGQILSAVSATLADPSRRTNLPLPLLFGQQAIATDRTLSVLPTAYLRGLLLGADRIEGAAQAALEATAALMERSAAPAGLSGGIQRLKGDLAATGAMLEIHRGSASALLASSATGTALPQLAASLWEGIDALLRIGQSANAPQLLPGFALPTPPRPPRTLQVDRPTEIQASLQRPTPHPRDPVARPVAPVPPEAAEEPARSLPEVLPTWHVAPNTTERMLPEPVVPAARALPQIGPQDASAAAIPHAPPATTPRPKPQNREQDRSVPEIGPLPLPGTKDYPGDLPPPAQPAEHRPMPELAPRPTHSTFSSGTFPTDAHGTSSRAGMPRPMPRIGDNHADPVSSGRLDEDRPGPQAGQSRAEQVPVPSQEGGRRIEPKDRWLLSGSSTRHRLRAAGLEDQAELALTAFWVGRDWMLSRAATAYLEEIAAQQSNGGMVQSGRSLDEPPYSSIFRVATHPLILLGETLQPGALIAFDYPHDRLLSLGPRDGVPD